MEDSQKLIYTVDECSALLGLHPNSLRAAIKRGDIPHIVVGRRILIPRRKIAQMLEGSAQSAAK